MKLIIVFDPTRINLEDLLKANNRIGDYFGLVRTRPSATQEPIFILGRRPSFLVGLYQRIFDRKERS